MYRDSGGSAVKRGWDGGVSTAVTGARGGEAGGGSAGGAVTAATSPAMGTATSGISVGLNAKWPERYASSRNRAISSRIALPR